MVAFKRLFHADKSVGPSCPEASNQDSRGENQYQSLVESPLVALNGRDSTFREHESPPSKSLDASRHFHDLEKRFEALHDRLEPRPSSAYSRPVSAATKRAPAANPDHRHVDLLEALFTSHRYRIRTSMLSPITPFNEDIAERNMTRFLQDQYVNGKAYSRFISAIYQEDVADRNIARSRGSSATGSRTSTRSSAGTTRFSASSQSSGHSRKKYDSQRSSAPVRRDLKRSTTASSDNLRPRSYSPRGGRFKSIYEQSGGQSLRLRPQKSAPDLLAARSEERLTVKQTQSSTPFLGVPAAHKAGDVYSNTPLPDSPTVPEMMMPRPASREEKEAWSAPESRRCSSLGSRTPYKRNIRDLSINTSLAALAKPGPRISHRAVQPPTPQHLDPKRPLSIAEVMSRPLPSVPTPVTSSPLLTSGYNVLEIMNMFKQAFASTASMSPHHPTLETLQDAIVREINSHEAFRRVPVPEPGPLFTPLPTQQAFDESSAGQQKRPALVRSLSEKESHFARILKMSPTRRNRRTAESRKSISTSMPSLGYEKLFKHSIGAVPRRRHTDAQPPTASFWKSMVQQQQQQASDASGQDLPYMDLLLPRRQDASAPKSTRPQSTSAAAARSSITVSSTRNSGTVYRMLAHSAESASEEFSSTSPNDQEKTSDNHNDNDHDNNARSPHIEPPRVQVQSVDDNNVTYTINHTTPEDAERLVNWPQRAVEKDKLVSSSSSPSSSTSSSSSSCIEPADGGDRSLSPDSPTLPRVTKKY